MATAPVAADTSRLSFAKVAASAGKDNLALGTFARVAASGSARDSKKESVSTNQNNKGEPEISKHHKATRSEVEQSSESAVTVPNQQTSNSTAPSLAAPESSINEAKLVDAIQRLGVSSPMPSLVVNGSGDVGVRSKADVIDGFSEDLSQRADSSSDLGTKPPSLDGKSITSGTTFALDEKESLRPDDSASVKAAEDDDTFSGRGSIVAGSRIGSEAAARAYRSQFYAEERRNMPPMQERQSQGVNTPQSGSSDQQATDDGKPKPLIDPTTAPEGFNLFYRQTPDDKLLEALDSPKDRIFLLRLEQSVIEFVKSSKEPFIDLPPCNSFCRMLTHKLADYYHMTHQVDTAAQTVRIFRTPFCRLPPSLTAVSNPPTSGSTPPPVVPMMKIMRRGGDGDTGPSPSKATSETGSDGKDKSLSAKEKLSREEREAAYNKARERIFGKEENIGDMTPETEDGNEMSRSSSVSTKDRASQNKRPKTTKQRRDEPESFDVRSQYTAFYPQPQVPTWLPTPQYPPMVSQQFNAGVAQNGYQNPLPSQFVPPTQQYNQAMMVNGGMQAYNNMPQQYAQQNPARFQQPHSAPITAYGSPVQTPPIASQQWGPAPAPLYQPQYQPQGSAVRGPPHTVPYAFGQLPSTANPADPKSQHPIPGSFNRHAFNPKTQSFVPGNVGLPVPQPMSHHGSPHHGSPHQGSSHLSYNPYPPPQQQQYGGMGYNMARQGSNNSLPSYHASPHMASRPIMHQNMPQGLPQGMPHGAVPGMPQNPTQNMSMHQQNGQVGKHLPNYGNPNTLPPKPTGL